MAGYHDGALLFGKVLRERMLARQRGSADVPLSDNPFGNASFHGACRSVTTQINSPMRGRITVPCKTNSANTNQGHIPQGVIGQWVGGFTGQEDVHGRFNIKESD